MRPFGPDRLRRGVDSAVHHHRARAEHPALGQVDPLHPQRAVAGICLAALGDIVVDHPRGAVVVEEQRGVDAIERYPYRVRPRTRRVLCGDVVVAAGAHAGVEHVERVLVP